MKVILKYELEKLRRIVGPPVTCTYKLTRIEEALLEAGRVIDDLRSQALTKPIDNIGLIDTNKTQ